MIQDLVVYCLGFCFCDECNCDVVSGINKLLLEIVLNVITCISESWDHDGIDFSIICVLIIAIFHGNLVFFV